jgi:hypothetical protein
VTRRDCWGAITALGICARAWAQSDDSHDPEFDKVPFREWIAEGRGGPIKWSNRIAPVVLSDHQRLVASLEIELDGSEVAKRRGAGQIIFYFQIEDAAGRVYQQHGSFDLEKVEKSFVKNSAVTCTDHAFVLPGEYTVTFAIGSTATGAHSTHRQTLRVPQMSNDPLPQLWRDLPPVWFFSDTDTPELWFQPKDHGKLYLPFHTRRPIEIEVVANLEASQMDAGSYRAQAVDLSRLLPYLKVLSFLGGPEVRKTFSLMDVKRRRVVFEQRVAEELDWNAIHSGLRKVNTGLIDRASLESQQEVASFFVREVMRRMQSEKGGPAKVVIMLSGPMIFDARQNKVEVQAAPPESRLFYLRMQGAPRLANPTPALEEAREGSADRPAGANPARNRTQQTPALITSYDELARLFSGARTRLIEIQTPHSFREALRSMAEEISGPAAAP